MSSQSNVTPGPIAPENNPPIEPQYFVPGRFVVTNIEMGPTTLITTSEPTNYLVGQLIRLLIPQYFGAVQLNAMQGYVVSIPEDNQVYISVNSNGFVPFGYRGPSAVITGISQANPCVITASNYFVAGLDVMISGVGGMTELNGNEYSILSVTNTSITINVDSTSFSAYTSAGTAILLTPGKNNLPQIIAIGDINSGQINGNGPNTATFVPGSFINVS